MPHAGYAGAHVLAAAPRRGADAKRAVCPARSQPARPEQQRPAAVLPVRDLTVHASNVQQQGLTLNCAGTCASGHGPARRMPARPRPSRGSSCRPAMVRYTACRVYHGMLTQTAAPWLLNVPVAFGELAARGPHAVVGQAGSIMGRAACTKCRGMNPLLGAHTAAALH